jgi:hypothetical protein
MALIRIDLPDPRALEAMIRKALPAAAVAAVSLIQRRTAQGVDMHGRPFVSYSRRYGALKAESGRNVDPPDLTLTGQMLRNLKVKTATSSTDATFGGRSREIRIGFDGQHRRSRLRRNRRGKVTLSRTRGTSTMADVVLGNQATRPFFGIVTAADVARVQAAFTRRLDELIREANASK